MAVKAVFSAVTTTAAAVAAVTTTAVADKSEKGAVSFHSSFFR